MARNRSTIRSPKPLQLRYIYGGVIRYRPGDTLATRVMRDFELVLMIEGCATYRLEGTDHAAPPGTVIFARPGFREAYFWDKVSRTRHAYFHFNIDHMPSDWPSQDRWPVVIRHPDAVVGPLFVKIIEHIAMLPDWRTLSPGINECRLVECLIRILLSPARSNPSIEQSGPEPVNQALHFMREILELRPHKEVHLHDLARRAGVTEKHLCRQFQQAVGHPPMKTFMLLKLQLALALLARSNLSIKEIADRCGFDNPLYFTRCFTKAYGSSPSNVRDRLLNQEPPPPNLLPPDIAPRLSF